jgi:hypothetical protein
VNTCVQPTASQSSSLSRGNGGVKRHHFGEGLQLAPPTSLGREEEGHNLTANLGRGELGQGLGAARHGALGSSLGRTRHTADWILREVIVDLHREGGGGGNTAANSR